MDKILFVGLGGFVGANLRYWVAVWIGGRTFPLATFAVNIIGAFGLAFFAVWAVERVALSEDLRLLVATGFFGALTTFSTFSLEALTLMRDGKWEVGLLYMASSVILGILGAAGGMALARV
jgi:CrcB protein